MLLYSVFGLRLQANRPVPGLVPSAARPASEVQLWLNSMPARLHEMLQAPQREWYVSPYQDERGEPALTIWELAGGSYFRLLYSDATEFLVDRQGTRVWAIWPATATLEDTATYLLGPVMGFVLALRGVTCLHASAVAVGDQAIALLGPAGAGKSTTAAAFAERGYPVLSEDVVPLGDQGNWFVVQPGYPCIRLWPDSVNSLFGSSEALPRLTPSWDKRCLELRSNGYRFHQQPLPLAAIYLLGERRSDPVAPFVESLTARTGLISLVGNSYANRLLDRAMRAREFDLLARAAASVPLRQVNPHVDPAYLPELCDVILRDLQALCPPVSDLTVAAHGERV